jgi:hypothetical protein
MRVREKQFHLFIYLIAYIKTSEQQQRMVDKFFNVARQSTLL